jgi:hypothetical protein
MSARYEHTPHAGTDGRTWCDTCEGLADECPGRLRAALDAAEARAAASEREVAELRAKIAAIQAGASDK